MDDKDFRRLFGTTYGRIERGFPAETQRNVPLQTIPHYTDERFRTEQTVFGSKRPGLHYDYSDRLWQWDYKKAEEATKVADDSKAVKRSATWYDAYLSAYFGKPTKVHHILAGVNQSNGYPYAVFGYAFQNETSRES